LEVSSSLTTILFTDIEGSTVCGAGRRAHGRRPGTARCAGPLAVDDNHGVIVKTTGDGLFAAFHDPLDAVKATVTFQLSLADPRSPRIPIACAAACTRRARAAR
jgi:class 3 adenylate cyclase